MRLPVTPQISTKDGVSNKNARLTNVLKETRKTGELAVVRPGLSLSTTYAGLGNGLIVFDGRLLMMVDDTIYDPEWHDYWPLDGDEWDVGTVYCFGDYVWYNETPWIWYGDCCAGVTPGTGYWYMSGYSTDSYSYTTTYSINNTVSVRGETYYAQQETAGVSPLTNELIWKKTPKPTYQYSVLYDPGNIFVTLTNGDLSASIKTNYGTRSTISHNSMKHYVEVIVDAPNTTSPVNIGPCVGIGRVNFSIPVGASAGSIGYVTYAGTGYVLVSGSMHEVSSFTVGDIIGIAADLELETVKFYKNNTLIGTYNLGDAGITAAESMYICVSSWVDLAGGENTMTCNFGQNSFQYTPPEGYNSGWYTESI